MGHFDSRGTTFILTVASGWSCGGVGLAVEGLVSHLVWRSLEVGKDWLCGFAGRAANGWVAA